MVIVTLDNDEQLLPTEVTISPGDTVVWLPYNANTSTVATEMAKVTIELLDEDRDVKKRDPEASREKKKKDRMKAHRCEKTNHPIFTFYMPGKYKISYHAGDIRAHNIVSVEEHCKWQTRRDVYVRL
jgi:plastocyanin